MQGTKARRGKTLQAHEKKARINIDYTYTHNIRTHIV